MIVIIMPYYGLFSRDLHILDLRWRSPLCSLLLVNITPVCTTFMKKVVIRGVISTGDQGYGDHLKTSHSTA